MCDSQSNPRQQEVAKTIHIRRVMGMITGIGTDLVEAVKTVERISKLENLSHFGYAIEEVGLSKDGSGLIVWGSSKNESVVGYWFTYYGEDNLYWAYGHYYKDARMAREEYIRATQINVWENGKTHYLE